MYIYPCLCAWCMCVGTCVWKSENTLCRHSLVTDHLFWLLVLFFWFLWLLRQSLTGLGLIKSKLGWLVRELQKAIASASPGLEWQTMHCLSHITVHGFWELNSAPHACKASLFLTELSVALIYGSFYSCTVNLAAQKTYSNFSEAEAQAWFGCLQSLMRL